MEYGWRRRNVSCLGLELETCWSRRMVTISIQIPRTENLLCEVYWILLTLGLVQIPSLPQIYGVTLSTWRITCLAWVASQWPRRCPWALQCMQLVNVPMSTVSPLHGSLPSTLTTGSGGLGFPPSNVDCSLRAFVGREKPAILCWLAQA